VLNLEIWELEIRLPNPLNGGALGDDGLLHFRHLAAARVAQTLNLQNPHDLSNRLGKKSECALNSIPCP
jgi:hypothetical protein